MKEKQVKAKRMAKSCCVIIRQKPCYEHEAGCMEHDLAIGWILEDENYGVHESRVLMDALERLGFTDGLARKV